MNNRDKIKEAIERAMARIGCPPGDNADVENFNAWLETNKLESP